MGIASGDLDGDGDLDIFVTGFGKEYNIYYEQVAPGLWKDETRKLGLVEPSLPWVGFGAQAIDLDNDGVDELVVTNGHIGDFQDDELSFEQPFQAFRRDQSGGFRVLEDNAWGEYFRKPHVGRALWTIDANGDGRNDLMLTHTDEQVRLLLVDGEDDNRRIGFKLVGTTCSRDAIGAIVRFEAGGRKRTLWCLTGHGYLCATNRCSGRVWGKPTKSTTFRSPGRTVALNNSDHSTRIASTRLSKANPRRSSRKRTSEPTT